MPYLETLIEPRRCSVLALSVLQLAFPALFLALYIASGYVVNTTGGRNSYLLEFWGVLYFGHHLRNLEGSHCLFQIVEGLNWTPDFGLKWLRSHRESH